MRFWYGKGKWCILGLIFSVLFFYQLIIALIVVTRFNIFLLFLFIIMVFISAFKLFW